MQASEKSPALYSAWVTPIPLQRDNFWCLNFSAQSNEQKIVVANNRANKLVQSLSIIISQCVVSLWFTQFFKFDIVNTFSAIVIHIIII